jgi:two-component system response regulator WspF
MKIAIVNDLKLAQEILKKIVQTVDNFQVIWVASDGYEALRLCGQNRPDIILMDLIMPEMDGVEATHRIMSEYPCAILIATASLESNSSKIYEAMGHGALDVIKIPSYEQIVDGAVSREIIQKMHVAAAIIGKKSTSVKDSEVSKVTRIPLIHPKKFLVIGASTGGPQALSNIFSQLPGDFPLPIVVVQHVDPEFAVGLAGWLNRTSQLSVQVARPKTVLESGNAYIACTKDHLIYRSNMLDYTQEPVDLVYRPSVDVFFKSLAKQPLQAGIAVLLTGMGQDGAEGLLALRAKGWHTIAQDEASSVVFGMPKAAIQLGAAKEVLPISEIPISILRNVTSVA